MKLLDSIVNFAKRPKKPQEGEVGKTVEGMLCIRGYGYYAIKDDLTEKKGISVYDQMVTDPDVKSALVLKVAGVLGKGWKFNAGVERDDPGFDAAETRATEVTDLINSMPGSFDDKLERILWDGLKVGVGIAEKVWELREDGKIGLKDLKSKNPGGFTFELDDFNNVVGMNLLGMGGIIPVPPEKFVWFTYQGEYGRPWGVSDLRPAYKYWWFKDQFAKWWAVHLEKFGSPPVKGSYPKGTSKDSQDKLLAVLKDFQHDTALVVPDDVTVELLVADMGSSAQQTGFGAGLTFCTHQIIKAILGQTLATEQGATGTYAQAKVHADVLSLYIRKLKRQFEEFVDEQVTRELVDYNWSDGIYPNFTLTINDGDVMVLAGMMVDLVKGQLVNPREPWIREYMGMPERDAALDKQTDDQAAAQATALAAKATAPQPSNQPTKPAGGQ